MNLSFRTKTILGIVTIEGLLLGILVWAGLQILQNTSDQALASRARMVTSLLASATRDAVVSPDLAALEALTTELLSKPEVRYVRILDSEGRILSEGSTPDEALPPSNESFHTNAGIFNASANIIQADTLRGRVELGFNAPSLLSVLRQAPAVGLIIAGLEIFLSVLFSLLVGIYLTRQHEAQKQARKYYQSILDSTTECVIGIDQDGKLIEFNPAAQATFGYHRDAVLGKPMAELIIPPAIREAHHQGMQHYLNTCEPSMLGKRVEVTAQRADGSEFPVELVVTAVTLGNRQMFTAFIHDITERQRTEQERILLMQAVEASPDCILITDTSGTFRYANPATHKLTGWDRQEILGQTPAMLKSGLMPEEIYQSLWSTLRRGETWHGRLKNRRKLAPGDTRSSLFWAQVTIAPVRDTDQHLQGYVAIERDISEQVAREIEQAFERESVELHAQVATILQSQEALFTRFLKIVQIISQSRQLNSRQICLLLTPENEEDAPRIISTQGEVYNSHEHYQNYQAIATLLLGIPTEQGQVLLADHLPFDPPQTDADSSQVECGYYAVPLSYAGQQLGFLLLLTKGPPLRNPHCLDMLQRIGEMLGLAVTNDRLQREMQRAQHNAEDAARTKSQFLANMSHEIRTPMNGILGMLDLLRETPMPKKQSQYVETAYRSADMLLNLINDVLDFSHIEAGQLHLEEIRFNPYELVEHATTLLAQRAHSKGLELTCFLADEIPTCLQGDPNRLHQILLNLIGNAVKFTERGEVSVHVTATPGDDQQILLHFEITDTGIGIDRETHQRLFLPFSQADGSINRKYGGTGLGLAISRQLVMLMGGDDIQIQTMPGHGSTFSFTLCYTVLPTPRITALNSLQGTRMLVVEDNATNREILSHYLQRWGVIHDIARDGFEALTQFRRAIALHQPYELIILDGQMPGMDGLELARRLRQHAGSSQIPIIMLSSLGQTINESADHGILVYMHKPVCQSQLHDTLLEALHGNKTEATSVEKHTHAKLNGRVLLVEDNEINQDVGLEMLRLLGVEAEIAEQGRQALQAVQTQKFDAVLMDCQMPEMDGYEATRAIREWEHQQQRSPIPIIAVTANAMTGDREACLAAGMDDYLAKPFSTRQLESILAHWLPKAATTVEVETSAAMAAPAQSATVADTPPLTAINYLDQEKVDELHQIMGPNLKRLIDKFDTTGRIILEDMQAAAAANDLAALAEIAHRLRGTSGNIGASVLSEHCKTMETDARQGMLDNPLERYQALLNSFEPTITALNDVTSAITPGQRG